MDQRYVAPVPMGTIIIPGNHPLPSGVPGDEPGTHPSVVLIQKALALSLATAQSDLEEARRTGNDIIVERARRLQQYYLALINAETNIWARWEFTLDADLIAGQTDPERWDSQFRRHLSEIRLGGSPLGVSPPL